MSCMVYWRGFKVIIKKQILRLINTNTYTLGMFLTTSVYSNLSILPWDSFFLVFRQTLFLFGFPPDPTLSWKVMEEEAGHAPLFKASCKKMFLFVQMYWILCASCIFMPCRFATAHVTWWRKLRINVAILQFFLREWGRRILNQILLHVLLVLNIGYII